MADGGQKLIAGALLLALIPLALLGVLVAWLFSQGAEGLFATDLPPVEDVHVLRHTLAEDVIYLDVVNAGPEVARRLPRC